MSFLFFIADYFRWHYTDAPFTMFHIWINFMRYAEQLFAVRLHILTLFAPWHRMTETPQRRFDLEAYAAAAVINIVSRFIGFLLRSTLIVIGLASMALMGIGIVAAMMIWYAAPLFASILILSGLALIITATYGNLG